MTEFVIIRDMSVGNETVGDMWQETKIFKETATLEEVMRWAEGTDYTNKAPGFGTSHSRKRITITRPHQVNENGE